MLLVLRVKPGEGCAVGRGLELELELELTRFHGQLKVLDLVGIFHQMGDGGFAVV
jgi:hypothetical protein